MCSNDPLVSTNFSLAVEGLGDLKTGGKIVKTVKYAYDLMLLAKEEI
jgi:hypothetical protein